MNLAAALAGTGTCIVSACSWDEPLRSDPNAWSPPVRVVEMPASAGAPMVGSECEQDPPHDPARRSSEAIAFSHRAGEPCLGACHVEGGSAKTVFEAAGTAYVAEGSRTLAGAGAKIHAVGGTTLVVDSCGNFYSVREALSASARASQPFVNDPLLRKMEKAVQRIDAPGNCNQSGCHDFSSKGTDGIFF